MEQMVVALSFTIGILLLAAGFIITVGSYQEHSEANAIADEYLELTIEEIAEIVSHPEFKQGWIRDDLLLFDKREASINRPGESWALIPYAIGLRDHALRALASAI
jgi:hypothetical protein